MKRFLFVTCLGLMVGLPVLAQSDEKVAKVSAQPVDGDQAAIYRSFIAGYTAGPKLTMNVANVTNIFEPDADDFAGCLKGFSATKSKNEVHSLADVFANNSTVRLVDPKLHKLDDPGDAIRQGQTVDDAVNRGFAAALMTLSEVRFDVSRTHAALSFSFHCGRLCGNGGIVIFEKQKGQWGRSKRKCGSWVS